MKRALLILMTGCFMGLMSGCGSVRYSLVGEKGKRGRQEVAWDVIRLDFNNIWKESLGIK